MKLIARTWRGLYVQDSQGGLHYVPTDGTAGFPIAYPDIQARELLAYAAEAQEEGQARRARRYRKAARALEALATARAA